MTTLKIRRTRGNSPPAPASLSYSSHGNNFYVRLKSDDGLDLTLGTTVYAFIAILRPLLTAMERSIGPPGISKMTAEPNGDTQYYDLSDRKHSYGLLILSRDFPNLPIERKLALLIERFKHSSADIYTQLVEDYKTATGKRYRGLDDVDEIDDQLAQDLLTAEARLDEIVVDGRVNQTKIAEIIGVPNGGSQYYRVQDVAAKLAEKLAA